MRPLEARGVVLIVGATIRLRIRARVGIRKAAVIAVGRLVRIIAKLAILTFKAYTILAL